MKTLATHNVRRDRFENRRGIRRNAALLRGKPTNNLYFKNKPRLSAPPELPAVYGHFLGPCRKQLICYEYQSSYSRTLDIVAPQLVQEVGGNHNSTDVAVCPGAPR